MKSTQITNLREVLAFSLANAIRITIQWTLTALVLAPFYGELARTGSGAWIAIWALGTGVGAFMWFAALPLFMALRGLFGGTPELVAGPGRGQAFASSGGEVGAYALSYLIEFILTQVLALLWLQSLYAFLLRSHQAFLARAVPIVIAILLTAVFFAIFIGLRRAFIGPRNIA